MASNQKYVGVRKLNHDINIYKVKIPLNLAFFNDSGEKTEPASPRKKQKARSEGNVLQSQEASVAVLFLTVFLGLRIFGGGIYNGIFAFATLSFERAGRNDIVFDTNTMSTVVWQAFGQVLLIVFPLFAIVMVTGLLINLAQVGWHPTTKPLKPKFSKISPLKGIKRVFSMRALVELVKSTLKLAVIGLCIYMIVMSEAHNLTKLLYMELYQIIALIGDIVINIGIMVGAMYIFIAGLDYLYQWWKRTKELRMTKQEVKEEYKQTEGNPQIKGAIRRKMREISMRRMMQSVPHADVIITNPTHYAIALKYDKKLGEAPVVVAKGVDYIARRIRESALQHGIEIIENKPLARTLYDAVDVGREIPPELYQAVAEIFAHLVNINRIAV